jgi:copper transport protein
MQKLTHTIALLALCLLMAGVLVPAASAHAIVVKTDPPDNAVLNNAPGQVRVWFSEEIIFERTEVSLVDNSGQSIPVKISGLLQGPQAGLSDRAMLVVDLPVLQPNVYSFSWRTVSSDDLHTTGGSLVFGVQQAPAAVHQSDRSPAPSVAEVLLRWLSLAGFSALVGALAFSLLLWPQSLGRPAAAWDSLRRRLLLMALLGIGLDLLAGPILLAVQQSAIPNQGASRVDALVQILFRTRFGLLWLGSMLVLTGLAGLVAYLLHRLNRGNLSSGPLIIAAAGASILCVPMALSSHPVTEFGVTAVRLATDALHFLAAAMWIGGLLVLVFVIVPLLRRNSVEREIAFSLLRRFGGLAATSMAVLAVTGLYLTGQLVSSLDMLLVTIYGKTLLFKTLLVVCTGLFGLLNSASLHPGIAEPLGRLLRRPRGWTPFYLLRLGRTVLLEAGLACGVLLMAALLGSTQPALQAHIEPSAKTSTANTSYFSQVDDLIMTLSVRPNRPGQNFVDVNVFNTRRPAPAPISRVLVRFTPPGGSMPELDTVAAALQGDLYRVNGMSFDSAGDWKIAVLIQRPGLPDARLDIPWTVLPGVVQAAEPPVLVSNRSIAPVMTWTSLLLSLALCSVMLVLALTRRTRRPSPPPAHDPGSG